MGEIAGIAGSLSLLIYLDQLIPFLTSQGMIDVKFIRYAPSMVDSGKAGLPISTLFYCSFLFLILHYVRKAEWNEKGFYLFLEWLLLLTMALLPVSLVGDGGTFRRGMFYFLFLSIIFLPMLLYDNKKICRFPKIFISVIIVFLLLYCSKAANVISNGSGSFPYHSEILGIK
jgi:hypothetical protein